MSDNKSNYEKFAAALGFSEKTQSAVKNLVNQGESIADTFKQIAGEYSKISSIISTAVSLGQAIGLLKGEESEFEKLYKKIEQALQPILEKLDESIKKGDLLSKQATLLQVAEMKHKADSALVAAENYVNAVQAKGDLKLLGDLIIKERVDGASDARDAVVALRDSESGYWKRTFDNTEICSLAWGKQKYVPENQSGFVWDYRLTLPAFLHTTYARMFILATEDPSYKSYSIELSEHATYLMKVYRKIYDGIVTVPAPPVNQQKIISVRKQQKVEEYVDTKVFEESLWENYQNPCGVVDIYSGSPFIESLPFKQPTRRLINRTVVIRTEYTKLGPKYITGPEYTPKEQAEMSLEDECYVNWFYLLFSIRTERARQRCYRAIGLLELWQRIVELKGLVGETISSIPPEFGFSFRRAIRSSVKILSDAGDEPLPPQLYAATIISLRTLTSVIGEKYTNIPSGSTFTSEISLRRILAGD